MQKFNKSIPAIAEIIFDIGYLIFVTCIGVFLIFKSSGNDQIKFYGILAMTLGVGDSIHLIPRIYGLWTNTMEVHIKILGFGKMVTSITMTIFYMLLYWFWMLFYKLPIADWLTYSVLTLAAIRILLCLLPQNGWFLKHPPLKFAIFRNIPFVILGGVIMVLFLLTGMKYKDGFCFMWIAILLSFIFYLLVIFLAGKNKKFGMFMLPKTCAYIWMIAMGLSLVR